jgi:peptidoglycan/LPS O-acetylase OafA/YrhL
MHRCAPALDVCSSLGRVRDSRLVADAVAAGAVAALLSGVPSTLDALARRTNPLEASLAAGTLLLPRERRASRLLPAALAAHAALSLGWALVLAALLPRRATVAWSLPAGLLIAALDLGVVGRRFPRIRALATAPQVLDHVAYAATVGCVLSRRRSRRAPVR